MIRRLKRESWRVRQNAVIAQLDSERRAAINAQQEIVRMRAALKDAELALKRVYGDWR